MKPVTVTEKIDWTKELNQTATKYHLIGCWVAIVLDPVWAIGDLFTIPDYFGIFLALRLIVAAISLTGLILKTKYNRISGEMLIFIPALGISLQNAYMYSVMDIPQLQKHTFAYIALFIGVGMLALWKPFYSYLLVGISLVANFIYFYFFSRLSSDEILINGGLLTATVAIFTILLIQTRYNLTKKEIIARLSLSASNKQLEIQKEIIEEKNIDITRSITYAKRIQDAILPLQSDIEKHLPEMFILFKPKDIVSGDFYWFSAKSGHPIIAAADCTGHGVPGSIMSMIGNSLLNQTVNEKGISEPAKILLNLKLGIISSLKQTGTSGEASDGMDIALCRIDKENKKIQFAGANNPLYILRKNQIIELKGDKQPIGIYYNSPDSPFTNQEVDIEPSDAFYLLSDGFPDQFGGPNNKKFRYQALKELLISIGHKPMKEQKEILNKTIGDWMKNVKQIDDILIIGFKP